MVSDNKCHFTVRLTSKIKSEDLGVLNTEYSKLDKGNIDILLDATAVESMYIVGEYNLSIPSIEISLNIPNMEVYNVITENKGLYITIQMYNINSDKDHRRFCFITTKQSIYQQEKYKYGIKLNGLLFIYSELLDSHVRVLGVDPNAITNMDTEVQGVSSSEALQYLLFDTSKGIRGKNHKGIEYNLVVDKSPKDYPWYKSDDKMIWIQHNISNIEMIRQLIKHSYLKEIKDIKDSDESPDDIDFLLFTFGLYTDMTPDKEYASVRAVSYKEFIKYTSSESNAYYKIIKHADYEKLEMENGSEVGDYRYREGTKVSEFKYMDKSKIPRETFFTKFLNPSKFFSDINRKVERFIEHRHNYGNTHYKFNVAPYYNQMNNYNLKNITLTLTYADFYIYFDLLDKVKLNVMEASIPKIINEKEYIVTGVSYIYHEGRGQTLVKLNRM